MENTESKHFHHESYCRKCDTPRTDALVHGGCIAINILEHARELEREINATNERMIEIKGRQASLIAAVNYAINEYGGSTASVYLARIMENLFSK
jgi:hypothetical protein